MSSLPPFRRARPPRVVLRSQTFVRCSQTFVRFGHAPPGHAKPSFSRLSRYDETGLIWLLQGRPVVALTETTAAIQSSTGALTIYRRHNKPALGPVGGSLDGLVEAPP
jgi:hypothetical protein